jgi:hypothetical protein
MARSALRYCATAEPANKGITPHIPVWERYQPTDRLDFTYDAERDVYLCPSDFHVLQRSIIELCMRLCRPIAVLSTK